MSGHNKWSSIKHKKAKVDAKKGKLFSKISKEIILAAKQGGGDPDTNPRLKAAIESAKDANFPNENIERCIKRGTGEIEGAQYEEVTYETYGPGGIALLIQCYTDNRNRSVADIRHILSRHNCSLAASGSVSFLFQRKTKVVIPASQTTEEKLMEIFFENNVDVENIEQDGDIIEIIAPPDAFNEIMTCLEKNSLSTIEAGVVPVPNSLTPIGDPKTAHQLMQLIEAIEEYDDVQNVYNNADISDEILEQVEKQYQ